MEHNLLVFVVASKAFCFGLICLGLLYAWTAAGRLFAIKHIPGWIQSRIFQRSDASRHQLGTFVGIFFSMSPWDGLVGRWGKNLSTSLQTSLVLLMDVDTGYSRSSCLDSDRVV